MSANSIWHWLLGHTQPARVAWAAAAHPLAARAGAAAPAQADGEARGEKEWEPGVWARAAAGIYS